MKRGRFGVDFVVSIIFTTISLLCIYKCSFFINANTYYHFSLRFWNLINVFLIKLYTLNMQCVCSLMNAYMPLSNNASTYFYTEQSHTCCKLSFQLASMFLIINSDILFLCFSSIPFQPLLHPSSQSTSRAPYSTKQHHQNNNLLSSPFLLIPS